MQILGQIKAGNKNDANGYLANLFTAAVQQRVGRLYEAAQSYRASIATWPAAPAAYFGLSEVLQRQGKGDESREVLLQGLAIERPGDPYWDYQFDGPGVADRRLTELREGIRR